eukprot:SAG11_NODE_56_length_19295_cov_20.219675_1_plen_60_part_00
MTLVRGRLRTMLSLEGNKHKTTTASTDLPKFSRLPSVQNASYVHYYVHTSRIRIMVSMG